MSDLKIGDAVILRSGGPDMTIVRFETVTLDGKLEERALCQWMQWHGGEVYSHVFPLLCLMPAPPKVKDQPEAPETTP